MARRLSSWQLLCVFLYLAILVADQHHQQVKEGKSNFKTYYRGHDVVDGRSEEQANLYQDLDPAANPNTQTDPAINQRDANLFSLWHSYKKATDGSEKAKILREITEEMTQRANLDGSVDLIWKVVYEPWKDTSILGREINGTFYGNATSNLGIHDRN